MNNKKNRTEKARYTRPLWVKLQLILLIIIFIIGAEITGKTLWENRKASAAYEALKLEASSMRGDEMNGGPSGEGTAALGPSMDFTPLKKINAEVVAWLQAEGTVIDYPVMHAGDNDFYLNHLYTGEHNRMGSLFVDYRNTGMFTDINTVIYGHNMNSGAMFNALGEYKKQDFYDVLPTMKLYTPQGDYLLELFSGTVENGDYQFVKFEFSCDEAFMSYIKDLQSRSTFQSPVQIEPGDRIVSLCTCSYEMFNGRYMVTAKLTPLF